MPVSTTHKQYDLMLPEWELVRACTKGQKAVKALGTKVLPAPGCKKGEYDKDRYEAYLKRAIYTNITGRTLAGLTGAAFRLAPTVDLPSRLEYLEEDADGAGLSLEQVAKRTLSQVLRVGREILLVDYPDVDSGMTQEQFEMLSPQAMIKGYRAESFINWRTTVIDGHEVLTLAVLKESYSEMEDEFSETCKDQYRVLRLTGEGYSQQVYRDGEPVTELMFPLQSNGQRFDIIPLVAVGSQYNDFDVDMVPLADIAYLNVGHYRNSADLEENAYVHGQLTLGVTSDLSSDEWEKMNPNGITVGSNAGHFLGAQGGFHKVQADPNQVADKLQERKEEQMLALGAKLVENKNPNETAAAAKIDATGENSVLADLVSNVEEAIIDCIEWCGLFMGESGEITYEMNRQFFPDSLDPQLIMAAIQGFDRSIIAKTDLQDSFRKAGLVKAERSNEEIDEENGMANPLE